MSQTVPSDQARAHLRAAARKSRDPRFSARSSERAGSGAAEPAGPRHMPPYDPDLHQYAGQPVQLPF